MPKNYDGKRKRFFGDRPLEHTFWDILKWRFLEKRSVWPKEVVPSSNIVQSSYDEASDSLRVTYIGHATLLVQSHALNILTDPHFSKRASPIPWLGPKRVQPPGIPISSLPRIDIIFISHNHYDHLDITSLKQIWKLYHPLIVTPLGNEKIIRKAIPKANIKTLDWHEKTDLSPKISLQLLPSQHWSRRYLWDTNKSLWGAACIFTDRQTFLFVGDTGFDEQLFKDIKETIGRPLDIAALPIGSYDPRWVMSYAHMSPEEAWKAFKILEGKVLIPTHYDVFHLADEPFGEALPRLKAAAMKESSRIRALNPGEYTEFVS